MYRHQLDPDGVGSACHLCLEQVPHAGAMSAEGKEYLFFFCGQGCYVNWHPVREGARVVVSGHSLGRA